MHSEFTITDEAWKHIWVPVLLRDDSRTNHMTISQFYHSIGITRVPRTGYNHTYKIIDDKKWLLAKIQYGL